MKGKKMPPKGMHKMPGMPPKGGHMMKDKDMKGYAHAAPKRKK